MAIVTEAFADERALVLACQAGTDAALASFYVRFFAPVYRYVLASVGGREDAVDRHPVARQESDRRTCRSRILVRLRVHGRVQPDPGRARRDCCRARPFDDAKQVLAHVSAVISNAPAAVPTIGGSAEAPPDLVVAPAQRPAQPRVLGAAYAVALGANAVLLAASGIAWCRRRNG